MDELVNIEVTGTCNIRGSDYVISLECSGSDSMTVQVEDRLSSDQWRASFDAQYVEDLTHKTGNFKQFNIFANMLESAISKASESVSLDLLTYKDLETLRQKKSGVSSSVKSSIPAPRTNSLTSKRYLILTYTVEFDRIHYPLPLPYVGKPDPKALQEEVRNLRAELQRSKQHHPSVDPRIEKLHRERLEKEKSELEKEYSAFRREVRHSSAGNAAQELRALKTMVRDLEERLMKEKTKYQRTTNKRSQEYRDLLEEVEELRASERNLRVRVKSLTNELAMYKRGRTLSRNNSRERGGSGDRRSVDPKRSSSLQRSSSNERSFGRSGSGDRLRPLSRERTQVLRRSNSSDQISQRSLNGSGTRPRSGSFDRNTSAGRSRLSTGSGSNRSRTPSPAVRRFNPTAYVKEKERKQKEVVLKKNREQRSQKSNLSGISSRSRHSVNSSRNSGYSYRHSRDNSLRSESNISDGYGSDGSYTSSLRVKNAGNKAKASRSANSPSLSASGRTSRPPQGKVVKQLASTPDFAYSKTQSRVKPASNAGSLVESGDDEDSEYFDRSAEISEIDERLNRLQQLMQATMPTHV